MGGGGLVDGVNGGGGGVRGNGVVVVNRGVGENVSIGCLIGMVNFNLMLGMY